MLKEAFGTGETVQDALNAACDELGIEPEKAEYEVLQEPEKKKFGLFGGNPAKVRAYVEITPAQASADYLRNILKCMGFDDVELAVTTDGESADINLIGDDIGCVIGRRGETLDALQYLTGLVANHVNSSYYRVTINTGSYREKRENTLENLGRKLAIKVSKTGKSINLEPMNPYERRFIHTAVQKINGAISYSEGEGAARHVVIAPDPKNPPKPRRSYSGGYNNRKGGKGSYSKGAYGKGDSGYDKKRRTGTSYSDSYKSDFERKPYQNKFNRPADDEMTTSVSTVSRRSPLEKSGMPLYSRIDRKSDEDESE